MYPTPDEENVIAAAEKLMVETMARYDPSHDAYHGERRVESLSRQLNRFSSPTRPKDGADHRAKRIRKPRSAGH